MSKMSSIASRSSSERVSGGMASSCAAGSRPRAMKLFDLESFGVGRDAFASDLF
jgi:hypothetical protein